MTEPAVVCFSLAQLIELRDLVEDRIQASRDLRRDVPSFPEDILRQIVDPIEIIRLIIVGAIERVHRDVADRVKAAGTTA